jgi:hypothetical protein
METAGFMCSSRQTVYRARQPSLLHRYTCTIVIQHVAPAITAAHARTIFFSAAAPAHGTVGPTY